MIIVADTTPINYLILIEQIHILEILFERIVIPASVHEELSRPRAPVPVRTWVKHLPAWMEIRSPAAAYELVTAKLDDGERDAIALALELNTPRIIIDELRGRKVARSHGLLVIGTLGILREAHRLGLVDLQTAITRLKTTNFHITPEMLKALIEPD